MIYLDLFVGLLIGLFLFLCTVKAYVIGLHHGRNISHDIAPKFEVNPIKPIIKAVEEHKEEAKAKELNEELTDIMSCSMESMLSAVKKER